VDIQCGDCHANRQPRVRLADWPNQLARARQRLPFPAGPEQKFLVTARQGTPLWHIRLGADRSLLYPKLGGPPLTIPPYTDASHPPTAGHQQLSCQACHSTWAPQCYGCHLEFTEQGEQWDHAARRPSPGVWRETRSLVRNRLPPLGVRADGSIHPHVPGMVFTAEHHALAQPLFRRLFTPLDPHTTGPARGCPDCHTDPVALGLGEGKLEYSAGSWRFSPTQGPAADGLPADAWTSLDGSLTGSSTRDAHRPFNAEQLRRILDAPAMPSALDTVRPASAPAVPRHSSWPQ